MRVRRFCGFVGGGLSHRVSLEVSSGVSSGQGYQAEDRAVTQRVVGGVIF